MEQNKHTVIRATNVERAAVDSTLHFAEVTLPVIGHCHRSEADDQKRKSKK